MKRNIGITRNFYRKLEKTETAYKEKIHQQFRCLEEEGESYPGLNYEKLLAQDEWYSIRLNKSDRAICKVNQDLIGKNYIFHNFGPHNVEEKIKIKEQPVFKEGISDIFEGIIENFESYANEAETAKLIDKDKVTEIKDVFKKASKEDYEKLFKKYLPEIMKIHGLKTDKELISKISKCKNKEQIVDELCDSNQETLFDMYTNNEKIYMFKNKEELEKLMNGKLKDWMLFLHKNQADVVGTKTGPMRVRGIVGSGKTSVAVHRVKYLLKEKYTSSEEKVLFIVFNRSLQKAVSELLRTLLPEYTDYNRAEVKTLHSWAADFLNARGVSLVDIQDLDKFLRESMDKAIINVPRASKLKVVVPDEIKYFIKGNHVGSLNEYLNMKRYGGRMKLNVKDRNTIYEVYEEYNNILEAEGVMDYDDLVNKSIEIIESDKTMKFNYSGIIVDEIQDFKKSDMLLIKKMAERTPLKMTNLMLVGDFKQKIYRAVYTFDSVGINVTGARSKVLNKNYRNTREIFALGRKIISSLKGKVESFESGNNIKEAFDEVNEVPKARGKKPILVKFKTEEDEAKNVVKKILALHNKNGYEFGDIGVFYRKSKRVKRLESELKKHHIKYIMNFNKDNCKVYGGDELKISSLHSAKGLEFKTVIILGVRDCMIPEYYEIKNHGDEGLIREQMLFYVGVTRAIKELYLTYSKVDCFWSNCSESRFLKGVDEDVLDRRNK